MKPNQPTSSKPSRAQLGRRLKSPHILPTLDQWRLTSILGKGTTATVYAATPIGHPIDAESDYAVKVLHAELEHDTAARKRLARETRATRGVAHANLITVLSASLQRAPYYLVMPRLRGATLARVLTEARQCTPPRSLWIARQIADALGALHASGFVHLDVKPANIMLDPSGHTTLIDLDLCLPCKSAFCLNHDVRGTLAYAAPELFTSTHAAQPASDVYSLGMVLYETLCGRLPFPCDSPAAYVESHLRQIPTSVRSHCPELPVELSRLVSRMLAKQADRRPSTDGELQDELARLEVASFTLRDLAVTPCGRGSNPLVASNVAGNFDADPSDTSSRSCRWLSASEWA